MELQKHPTGEEAFTGKSPVPNPVNPVHPVHFPFLADPNGLETGLLLCPASKKDVATKGTGST